MINSIIPGETEELVSGAGTPHDDLVFEWRVFAYTLGIIAAICITWYSALQWQYVANILAVMVLMGMVGSIVGALVAVLYMCVWMVVHRND